MTRPTNQTNLHYARIGTGDETDTWPPGLLVWSPWSGLPGLSPKGETKAVDHPTDRARFEIACGAGDAVRGRGTLPRTGSPGGAAGTRRRNAQVRDLPSAGELAKCERTTPVAFSREKGAAGRDQGTPHLFSRKGPAGRGPEPLALGGRDGD